MALEADGSGDMDKFLASAYPEGGTLAEAVTAKIAKIGENMSVRRYAKFEEPGTVYVGYTHGAGKIGVLVGLKTEASVEEVTACGKDVAMQVASMNPRFVDETGVDPAWLENEKEIAKAQLINEGKKPEMLERIIPGKVKAILKEVCLVDQKFVKNSDQTVKQYVDECAKAIGKEIQVVSMARFEVGEGIEKKEENFAEEVAKQMGN